jgi:hypothetical protein
MASFQERFIGALKVQPATFEEVEHDTTATSQAAIVVVAASVSSGLGWIWLGGFTGVIERTVISLVAWVVAAALVWIIGTKVLPGKNTEADLGQLLRTMGFARAPGLFGVIAIIPILGWALAFLIGIWGLIATVIAVRQALDYDDTVRAVIVCVLAWIGGFILMAIVGGVLGLGSRMMMF